MSAMYIPLFMHHNENKSDVHHIISADPAVSYSHQGW